jgi:hypothetical protein
LSLKCYMQGLHSHLTSAYTPLRIMLGFARYSEQTAIISLNNINRLISVMETVCYLWCRKWIFKCYWDEGCWLEVSILLEGPATGHLDAGFFGFPLSLSKFEVATAWFSCRLPDLNSWKLRSLVVKATKIYFSKFFQIRFQRVELFVATQRNTTVNLQFCTWQ